MLCCFCKKCKRAIVLQLGAQIVAQLLFWNCQIGAQLLFVLQWRGMTFWNWCSITVFDSMKLKLNCKTLMPNCKIGSTLQSIFFAILIISKIHFENDNLYFKGCSCEIWEQEFWESAKLKPIQHYLSSNYLKKGGYWRILVVCLHYQFYYLFLVLRMTSFVQWV